MQLFAAARGLSVVLLGWTFVSFVPEEESPTGTSPKAKTNRLVEESSLYLRMHAHNPVDWHPWGPEAFALAKKENKPVFLSIGYSSCYWCHVMERLVFENEDIAKQMNENFVCIKVDREERPDIDEVYMMSLIVYFRASGVKAGGGWPLSMFLTPEGKPIAGGTYFPPEDTERQLGFPTVLERLSGLWKDNRENLDSNADILANETRRLLKPKLSLTPAPLEKNLVDVCTQGLIDSADPMYGGVDFNPDQPQGPKFPVPGKLAFLQQQAGRRNQPEIDTVLDLTLRQMALGGIRDHLAGGFHRYTVDRAWSVPHFEKMLYDQAQLAVVYVEACRRAPNALYQAAACETLDFVLRELTLENGLFAGSLDAETDGVEGAYYVWSLEDVQKTLGEKDANLFADAYSVEAEPAFEHGNVLRLRKPLAELADDLKLEVREMEQRLAACRTKLLVARELRARPVRDDKVITGWNGLMIGALAQAGEFFERADYLAAAKRAATALLADVRDADGRLLRSVPTEKRRPTAFLEDYACLIDGLLKLQTATKTDRWQAAAVELQAQQDTFFADKSGGYFQSPSDQPELIVRSKTNSDAVQPGGNSVSIRNLLRLARLTGDENYRHRAESALKAFAANLQQFPLGNANLAAGLSEWLSLRSETSSPDSESDGPTIVLTSSEEVVADNPSKKKEYVKAKVFLSLDKLPAGEKCRFVVILDVQDGWHINANPPSPDNMIPTAVKVVGKHNSRQLDTKYPKGVEFTLEELPEPLSVYEGEVQIRGAIEAPDDAAGKKEELEFQITYQACNDKHCLPKKTLKLSGSIDIVKPGTQVKQINTKYFPAK